MKNRTKAALLTLFSSLLLTVVSLICTSIVRNSSETLGIILCGVSALLCCAFFWLSLTLIFDYHAITELLLDCWALEDDNKKVSSEGNNGSSRTIEDNIEKEATDNICGFWIE